MYSHYDQKKSSAKDRHLSLDVVGGKEAISEALTIQAAVAILEDQGHADLTVYINSLGDKDAFTAFETSLREYVRNNITQLSPACQELVKSSPLGLYVCTCGVCQAVLENAPKPIQFLNEESRKRFIELIEFLDQLQINFIIDETLINDRHYCADSIFEIRSADGTVLSQGHRQDDLVGRVGYRRELPHVEASVSLPSLKMLSQKKVTAVKNPNIFFVHLGKDARIKSLSAIERLRKNEIAVKHMLTETTCRPQMLEAEESKSRYIFVMGIKEALENSVLLRDTEKHSQATVRLPDITRVAKRLKL